MKWQSLCCRRFLFQKTSSLWSCQLIFYPLTQAENWQRYSCGKYRLSDKGYSDITTTSLQRIIINTIWCRQPLSRPYPNVSFIQRFLCNANKDAVPIVCMSHQYYNLYSNSLSSSDLDAVQEGRLILLIPLSILHSIF